MPIESVTAREPALRATVPRQLISSQSENVLQTPANRIVEPKLTELPPKSTLVLLNQNQNLDQLALQLELQAELELDRSAADARLALTVERVQIDRAASINHQRISPKKVVIFGSLELDVVA